MESILSVINEVAWIVVALAVYTLSLVFSTELMKHVRFMAGFNPLILSWIIGAGIFAVIIYVWGLFEASLACIGFFVVVTFAANVAYKRDWMALKRAVRDLFSLMGGGKK